MKTITVTKSKKGISKITNTTKINTAFYELFVEDHPTLHVIAFDSTHVLAKSDKTGKAFYAYDVSNEYSEGFSCCYHLLCEVGAIYQPWFTETIEMLKIQVVSTETETDYYEVLITYPEQKAL